MSVDIKVPSLGESVVEATVAKWYKNEGDSVALDEPLLELETDKVTLESLYRFLTQAVAHLARRCLPHFYTT